MSHFSSVGDGFPAELISWFAVPFDPLPIVFVPQLAPVQVPYSSASWWKPWPPSCSAAPGASVLPPENNIRVPPLFHQLLPLSMTARQSVLRLVGSALNAALTFVLSQFARRLLSSPQQPSVLEPQIAPVLTSLMPQMFTKLR